jgi:hypothetical protein
MEEKEILKINLRIHIPSDTCDCDFNCICRVYVKCNNGCFCGNKQKIYQKKSIYAPLTPDYDVFPVARMKKRTISFGSVSSLVIDPLMFKTKSPSYLLVKNYNEKFKNNFMSPQPMRKKCKIYEVETPLSV